MTSLHDMQGPDLRINPDPQVSRVQIKPEQHCLVLDNFLLNPQEVVDWVSAHDDELIMQERGYPGLLLPLTNFQARPIHAWVRSTLAREFGFLRGGLQSQTQFSLTTLQPEDFSWIQQLPHTDPRPPDGQVNYAALLYLFQDESLGGTGFYTWRDPDFLLEMKARQLEDPDAGLEILRERFPMFREAPAYTTETNDVAELLAMVPARFNRMVCYSGDIVHNAYIDHPEKLVRDPRAGRLTLNCFATVLPRT